MKLIEDWRLAGRLWSVRICAAAFALYTCLLVFAEQVHAIWVALPPELQAVVPHRDRIVPLIFLAAAIARVLRQQDRAA